MRELLTREKFTPINNLAHKKVLLQLLFIVHLSLDQVTNGSWS